MKNFYRVGPKTEPNRAMRSSPNHFNACGPRFLPTKHQISVLGVIFPEHVPGGGYAVRRDVPWAHVLMIVSRWMLIIRALGIALSLVCLVRKLERRSS